VGRLEAGAPREYGAREKVARTQGVFVACGSRAPVLYSPVFACTGTVIRSRFWG